MAFVLMATNVSSLMAPMSSDATRMLIPRIKQKSAMHSLKIMFVSMGIAATLTTTKILHNKKQFKI
jgi:hypothetical protein